MNNFRDYLFVISLLLDANGVDCVTIDIIILLSVRTSAVMTFYSE